MSEKKEKREKRGEERRRELVWLCARLFNGGLKAIGTEHCAQNSAIPRCFLFFFSFFFGCFFLRAHTTATTHCASSVVCVARLFPISPTLHKHTQTEEQHSSSPWFLAGFLLFFSFLFFSLPLLFLPLPLFPCSPVPLFPFSPCLSFFLCVQRDAVTNHGRRGRRIAQ